MGTTADMFATVSALRDAALRAARASADRLRRLDIGIADDIRRAAAGGAPLGDGYWKDRAAAARRFEIEIAVTGALHEIAVELGLEGGDRDQT